MKNIVAISIMFFLYSCGSTTSNDEKVEIQGPPICVEFDEEEIKKVVYEFNKGLVSKDTAILNGLLHDELSYGHSNGWVETKQELKNDLYNGVLTYNNIEQQELAIIYQGDVVTVRGNGVFDVNYKGTEHLLFDLSVMQTWIWEKGRWQMLNRQSVSNKK